MVIVILAGLAGCGGEGSGDKQDKSALSTSTTAGTTSTTAAFRTEIGAPPPAGAVVVQMKDYKFFPATLRTPSTGIQIALSNDEPPCAVATCEEADLVHDLVILDGSTGLPIARSTRLAPGEAGLFVVDSLPEGSYRFFCALHVPASMEGTLEVVAR